MIREFFFPLNLPLILVGDFNESPDETVYREFIHAGQPPSGYLEAGASAAEEEATTQHGFDGRPRGSRIDWILTTPPFCGPAGGHGHG